MTRHGEHLFRIHRGPGPWVATAVHCGHEIRPELRPLLALDEATRRREEDPYTDRLAEVVPTRILPRRSRFEVDLNRPREEAVYRRPEDAWGLTVWRRPLPEAAVAVSLTEDDAFYGALETLLAEKARQGPFVLLDLHAYNHRRAGPEAPPEDPAANPDVNVGTGTLDRARWGPVVDAFMETLRRQPLPGGPLDVRENVKFRGRALAAWVHRRFAGRGCALAVEFKKTFVDEWTGRLDAARLEALRRALAATLPALARALEALPRG